MVKFYFLNFCLVESICVIVNIKQWKTRRSSDLSVVYISPWSILQEAFSKSKEDRLRAVEKIAAYKDWHGNFCILRFVFCCLILKNIV